MPFMEASFIEARHDLRAMTRPTKLSSNHLAKCKKVIPMGYDLPHKKLARQLLAYLRG